MLVLQSNAYTERPERQDLVYVQSRVKVPNDIRRNIYRAVPEGGWKTQASIVLVNLGVMRGKSIHGE